MASEGQSQEREDPSEDLTTHFRGNRTSHWGAILSAVKDQIPSLDSDTSASDCDEDGELFIFQRDLPNLIPDLSEELTDLSPGDPDMQQILESVGHSRETWNGDLESSVLRKEMDVTQAVRRENVRAVRDQTPAFANLTEETSSQQRAVLADPTDQTVRGKELGKEKDRETEGFWINKVLSMKEPYFVDANNSQERRKMIETKILSKVTLEAPSGDGGNSELKTKSPLDTISDNLERITQAENEQGATSAEHPQGLMLFSLQDIEKWDLDKILEDLEEQKDSRTHSEEPALPSKDHKALIARSQSRLMEKLEELCAKQSKALSPRHRKPLATLAHFQEHQGDQKKVVFPPPPWSCQSMDMPELQCTAEPPTVYIDLRDAKPHKSVLPSIENQSLNDSSTEDEEDTTVKDEQKTQERMQDSSQGPWDCTGKSLLLQQLRNFRKEASQPLANEASKQVLRDEGVSQDLESPEEMGTLKIRRKRYLRVRGEANKVTSRWLVHSDSQRGNPPLPNHVKHRADPSRENQKETEDTLHSGSAPEPPLNKAAESPRAEESLRELSLKKKQMKEKHRRQRLQEQLERLQPQHSVTGKQPMAEKTPVLFHLEASYLPAINTLPSADSANGEKLLMTIWLASCGQVAMCGQHSGRFPDTVLTAASIYQALVTWLLSLAKEALRGTTIFYQQMSAYLSHTWLPNVIWWSRELTSRLQNQLYPLLPEIPAVRLNCITTINPDPKAVEKAFAMPAGFYWQTVETDEKYFPDSSDIGASTDIDTEVAVTLLFETLLRTPLAVHHMLQLILSSGLDICGLRLLYPQHSMLLASTDKLPSTYDPEAGKAPPVLALGLRGPKAGSALQDIIGPSDPQLASMTDCGSINAIYCRSQAEPLAYLPHTDSRVHRELCLLFGGRACCDEVLHVGVQNPACKYNKSRPQSPSFNRANADQERADLQDMALSRPPATLVSTTKGDVILVVSPAVPPHAYGDVISTCTQRGFTLQGIKQLRLSPKRAIMLSMTTSQMAVFCPNKTSSLPDGRSSREELPAEPRLHCLILLLRKENAGHHVPALVKGLMKEMAERGLLGEVRSNLPPSAELEPALCIHVAPYTDSLLQTLGGNLSAVPDSCNVPLDLLCHRTYALDPEMEQVVILTLIGKEAMKSAGHLLCQILHPGFLKQAQNPEGLDPGFELLSLKWLPQLTRSQAKEVTPFEVGDTSWQRSINMLMSSPALICALRRVNAFGVLAEMLKKLTLLGDKPSTNTSDLQRVMALTPEMAFRQAVLFFTEKEFISDCKRRPAMKYLPPYGRSSRAEGGETRRGHAESLFTYMQAGAQLLCTVLLIKPGVWARSLARILRKLDLEKFSLVGMKHISLKPDIVLGFLSSEAKQEPSILEAHCSYLTSGSSLVLCLQRENAVKKLVDLLGPEDPVLAQTLDPCLWRAQYGASSIQNGFYGSRSYHAAVRDTKLFFPEGLCCADWQVLKEEEICNMKCDPIVRTEISKRRRIVKHETRRQLNFLGSEQQRSLDLPLLDTLCQTTCLILPGIILQGSEHPPYLGLLDQLVGRDFRVTGLRLTVLDKSQARLISETLSTEGCNISTMHSLLDGACLVVAAQRDNAVICFDSLLDSGRWQKQAVLNCMQHLLYPQTEKQAEELLCCLFDSLTTDSFYRIETQDS
ncbi:dynein axonemal assembly factor 8 isoform X4 [Gopherus flavomarginatus]|uniref:dynein axonemal assembly factor 8 isoform X4 n=1 Tax=Gopherus flavomarginatus TaxID=286002 RepID=UPI0021CC2140|nr:dynein axonemal assembly factor 8 isoform X4 [Gopherus flavomarginatus]